MFACNWLALVPWRRSKDKHWSEQARLSYPALVAARANVFSFPAISAILVVLIWPDSSPLWFYTGAASYLGALLGQVPAHREVFPRIRPRELLVQLLANLLLRSPLWFALIMTTVFMPPEPNGATLLLGIFLYIVVDLWVHFGSWMARKIGFIRPAPERLRTIAEAASAKMGIKFREVSVIRSPMAQAFAIIGKRRLLFTERILDVLSDDELAAVCAHELAHLTESRWIRASRSIQILTVWPWIFLKPAVHFCGVFGLLGLSLTTFFVPRIYRMISHKMESRADQMAQSTAVDTGAYASALARLYEDNLAPAVNALARATHPHLYDRMLAAGVTPDFPRPAAPKRMAFHGHFFASLVGLLFVFLMLHCGFFFHSPES